MRLSQLAIILDRHVPRIPDPRISLEQYTTPGDLAARIAWYLLESYGDLSKHTIVDLGAGTGMLSTAAGLIGAGRILAVEYDVRLLPVISEVAEELGLDSVILPVRSYVRPGYELFKPGSIDIVVMNPPFGVWNPGADTRFIMYAFNLRAKHIIAILKLGNIHYFKRLGAGRGYKVRSLFQYDFPIPATMMKHRSRIRRIPVEVIEFELE
jgi:putative methylase